LGITWIRNGVVVDRPAEEDNSVPAGDGRSYLPYASKTYLQDGSTEVVTGRAFNAAIKLPESGNVTRVMGAPKTEASDKSQDGSDQIANLQQARAAMDAANAAQKAQQNAAIASATNLVTIGSVPGTANYTAVVKPKS
jgi:beta-lactam-binding protein with PASTA domain